MFGNDPEQVELIRIGAGAARIVSISQLQIEYIGSTGQRCIIDLQECARNWAQWHSDHNDEFIAVTDDSPADIDGWNAHCVGTRGALDDPPWVQFMNQRHTRFEFGSYEAIYQEVLTPISRYGWHTFDTD